MTVAALKAEYLPSRSHTRVSVSAESKEVAQKIRDASLHFQESSASQKRNALRNVAMSNLSNSFHRCVSPNWDGYGAQPASAEALFHAAKILEKLPTNFPIPDVEILPTGDIGLEWYRGKGQSFVLAVSEEGILSYAGLFGPGITAHGREYWVDVIPSPILQALQRLFE